MPPATSTHPILTPTASSRQIRTKPSPPLIYNHSTLTLPPDRIIIFGGQNGPSSAGGLSSSSSSSNASWSSVSSAVDQRQNHQQRISPSSTRQKQQQQHQFRSQQQQTVQPPLYNAFSSSFSNSSAELLLSDHLYEYNLQSESMERIYVHDLSPVPSKRMDAALAWCHVPLDCIGCRKDERKWRDTQNQRQIPHLMLMHGGFGLHSCELADLWLFDLHTSHWHEIKYRGAPLGLSAHHMFVSKGELYMVRGVYDWAEDDTESQDTDLYDQHHLHGPTQDAMEIYILNLHTLCWRRMEFNHSPYAPCMRESYVARLAEDAQSFLTGKSFQGGSPLKYGLLLFGGEAQDHGTLMDLWQLRKSQGKIQWEEHLTFSDEKPSPRVGAQILWMCGRWVILYGGDSGSDDALDMDTDDASFYLLDLNDGEWQRMRVIGRPPPKGRVGHSMSLLYHPVQQCWKIIVFGGRISTDETSNDIYEITLQHKFESRDTSATSPLNQYEELYQQDERAHSEEVMEQMEAFSDDDPVDILEVKEHTFGKRSSMRIRSPLGDDALDLDDSSVDEDAEYDDNELYAGAYPHDTEDMLRPEVEIGSKVAPPAA
eukprot:CAMPEP_0117443446 /NCGR_PEP_ID=MMETSP0759-20121206/4698_1 /TAXON_ID=63605 /ORGANISM="Percolomonas cosmopolitus, Strain WS" /LENGTH=596 /DNA_ID=CAMNT_0005235419 /DNA_START=374 /DNA_END=2161 /DNA_ORIENTATION=+